MANFYTKIWSSLSHIGRSTKDSAQNAVIPLYTIVLKRKKHEPPPVDIDYTDITSPRRLRLSVTAYQLWLVINQKRYWMNFFRKASVIPIAVLLGFSASSADNVAGAPQTAERVLIIYNGLGFAGTYQFSEPSSWTFKAALTEDKTQVVDAANANIPSFSPHPTVDMLKVTQANVGIYPELTATFGTSIPDSLKNGKELSYWTQVYDLRFDNNQSGVEAITLDLASATSDLSLYKTFLTRGGSLYVQGEYSAFQSRNQGVTSLINLLTDDVFTTASITNVPADGSAAKISTYPSSPENFSTDFNDLNAIAAQTPDNKLTLIYAGCYPLSMIKGGVSLITSPTDPGYSHMLYWGSPHLKTQNGRLIVGFDINCWSDNTAGLVAEGAYAVIQNIYDLLSGSESYTVSKAFSPSSGNVGDTGSFIISVTNTGKSNLATMVVTDTVSSCLQIIDANPAWTTKTGTVLNWTLPVMTSGSTTNITVRFKASQMPPCP